MRHTEVARAVRAVAQGTGIGHRAHLELAVEFARQVECCHRVRVRGRLRLRAAAAAAPTRLERRADPRVRSARKTQANVSISPLLSSLLFSSTTRRLAIGRAGIKQRVPQQVRQFGECRAHRVERAARAGAEPRGGRRQLRVVRVRARAQIDHCALGERLQPAATPIINTLYGKEDSYVTQ